MTAQLQQILESKRSMRRQLAALSFSEKVKILERLRDRSLLPAASLLRRAKSHPSTGAVGVDKTS